VLVFHYEDAARLDVIGKFARRFQTRLSFRQVLASETAPAIIVRAMDRRQFVGIFGVAAATGSLLAQSKKAVLPQRRELLLRNAYVMTMDPALGDIAGGDVHIRNGEIAAVGKSLKAAGATIIDAQRMIALPGLIDTHWHMWNTLLRSFAGEKADHGYFPTAAALGAVMMPEDMYHGTRLGAAEALYSGITTVHDYCHNVRSRTHAEADIRALQEAGIRARWSYGWPQGYPDTETINLQDLEAFHRDWLPFSNEGLIRLGFAWRGMFRNSPLPQKVYRTEFDAARKLGIPISAHIGSSEEAKGQIEAHAKENLLGKDVQIIHGVSASLAEIQMVAKAGASLSVSPGTELRIGYGFAKVSEFLDAGIRVGMSVDTTALAGDANPFDIMKMIRNNENARGHSEFKLPAKRVLELGTIEGARSLGIDDQVGSLKPGKRADIIMISMDNINLGVFTDPSHMVVEAVQPANVDTVIVDGRVLKRAGKLTSLAPDQVLRDAASSFDTIRKRANWR
jgi:5-methylthioadenosine/S-adenosylhomocysteine deaminase